jgi:hypothetical protein
MVLKISVYYLQYGSLLGPGNFQVQFGTKVVYPSFVVLGEG